MKLFLFFLLPVTLLFFAGCVQQIAVSTIGDIVDEGYVALTEERDLVFAEQALPANLKLIEVMLANNPDNTRLLRLASEGYCSYALGFIEDSDVERARMFYLRGHQYGLRIVRQDRELAKALDGQIDDLKAELVKRGKEAVPGIFWSAFGLGSYVSLSLTNPDALAEIPKVEALMNFVAGVDSSFYHAGADIFLGTLYGSRPKIFGGDEVRSRAHFEKALRINGGRFLMTYVYYARSYAVATLNETLFDQLLGKVEQTPLDDSPRDRLANAIAKRKAKLLLARKSELF
jgi:hypothetical protein